VIFVILTEEQGFSEIWIGEIFFGCCKAKAIFYGVLGISIVLVFLLIPRILSFFRSFIVSFFSFL
jgi:hypothetical protein